MELALSQTTKSGPIVNARYRLGAILGAGGMGTVHEAEHLALGERVALKLLRPDYAAMPELCERFLREAKSLFRIHHENVVRVLDVDTWAEAGASGPAVPYIVMDFVEGVSVDRLLAKRGRIAYGEAVEIVRQTCEGLGEAHRLGIVHRDVKPHNVMVTSRGDGTATVKLLDFGIAQMDSGMSTRLTVTEAVIGTPSYMSPEQLRSARAADARSDVWSCGVVLYELLTGQLPWNAASPGDLAVRMYMEPLAARAHPFPADVPAEVVAIVLRCLSLEPEARWADATALADALAPFAADLSDADIATAGSVRAKAGRRTPNPRRPSRSELTFARQKVHGEDGRTAFELHELVPREARERQGSGAETGPRPLASTPPAHASTPAPVAPASPFGQLSFASLVAIVAGAVGFLVLLLGVLLVVIATRPDAKTTSTSSTSTSTSAAPSATISPVVVPPKPAEAAPTAAKVEAEAPKPTEKAVLVEKPKATTPAASATGERRTPAPKTSSTASFFTEKW